LTKANLIDAPTKNRKKGNTRSVSVQPCHFAWRSGGYTLAQLPGLFTMIIRAIVIPLNMSIEYMRLGSDIFN